MNHSMMHAVACQYGITPLPDCPVTGMAYVPYQRADKVYSAEQGITVGTMFPELNKPFKGKTVGDEQ